MEAFDFGRQLGGFVISIGVGYIFLALLWLIPPLRRNKPVWYALAAVPAIGVMFVSIEGPTPGLVAGALAFCILAWIRARPK